MLDSEVTHDWRVVTVKLCSAYLRFSMTRKNFSTGKPRPKKIMLLFPEMRVTKKIITRAAGKKKFSNLVEFSKQRKFFTLKKLV